jgi:hypothetical protein
MLHVWREEGYIQGFWCGNLRGNGHFEEPGIEGKQYQNGSSRSELRVMEWIYLAQDRDRRRAVVDAIVNLRVPSNEENFLTS